MKNTITYIAIFLASTTYAMANNDQTPTNGNGAPVVENKTIVRATGECLNNKVHFELELMNESDEVYFALKREYADGRFETAKYVKVNNITPQVEDLPTFQNIEDENVPSEDFSYVLMRINPITRKFTVIQRWDYCSDTHELCTEEILAAN